MNFPIAIQTSTKSRTGFINIRMDANRLERFAAACSFFSKSFIQSIDRAEADIKAGRVKKVTSFTQLRSK